MSVIKKVGSRKFRRCSKHIRQDAFEIQKAHMMDFFLTKKNVCNMQ